MSVAFIAGLIVLVAILLIALKQRSGPRVTIVESNETESQEVDGR